MVLVEFGTALHSKGGVVDKPDSPLEPQPPIVRDINIQAERVTPVEIVLKVDSNTSMDTIMAKLHEEKQKVIKDMAKKPKHNLRDAKGHFIPKPKGP